MSRLRQVAKFLGKSGIDFLITLALYFIFHWTRHGLLALLAWLALIPPAIIILVRVFRYIKRNALWSVRNRLLFAYGLMGILPILLLFILVGLGSWALINELAIYLASSELNRRLESLTEAVQLIRDLPPNSLMSAAPEIEKGFSHAFPHLALYVFDKTGQHRFPPDSPVLNVPPGWQNVHGLLVFDHRFYGWAHYTGSDREITVLAPISDETVENLVPNLGEISLLEGPEESKAEGGDLASAGSFRSIDTGSAKNPDVKFTVSDSSMGVTPAPGKHLPPAAFSFDIPVGWPATFPHYHLNRINKTEEGVLWVYSRPSAVLGSFFSGTEFLRGILFDAVITVAILFLIVELIAAIIGIQLSRRLTYAVNQLYEGTRRVIFGDFSHRIQVREKDQLGELGASFNQMTSNLERLMAVEKEKERLQTELEIAREVQAQLYPKEAPPMCGLKLTVRCDPARLVSGDYYDYQNVGEGQMAFAIGDVAGKGISAALLMATLAAALRAQLSQHQMLEPDECTGLPEIDVAHLVSALNKQIYAHSSPEKYATFFFAVFNQSTRTLTYTNAGHLSPLLFRNGQVVPLDSNGTVVGAFPFAKYDESCLTMHAGDLLVCYTDGITEPENAYGEMFGEERLIELVQKYSAREDHEILGIVLDAVRSWTASPELQDDMTLLIARGVQIT
ncbi:MAG: PP2C family protein-serine/threonine phosphatase [Acidobacteriaceae bacterium]|nr:PP2C family protein-serine/threonine phosphatase [Acidobacteriaceae bacterium]